MTWLKSLVMERLIVQLKIISSQIFASAKAAIEAAGGEAVIL